MKTSMRHLVLVAAACVAVAGLASAPAFANPPTSSVVKSKQQIPDGVANAYGSAVVAIGDVNGDGIQDFAVGSRAANSNAGLVTILLMNRNGTVASSLPISGASAPLVGLVHPDDEFGASVAALGDLDGDGVPDIAIGAPNNDDVTPAHLGTGLGVDRGAVFVVLLNSGGTPKAAYKLSDLTAGMNLPSDFERFGAAVASLGNFDGAGPADLVLAVGAPGDRDADVPPGSMRGAVYELFLTFNRVSRVLGLDHVVKLSDTQGTPASLQLHDTDLFGSSLAALADLNGDGIPDLAVGAPLDDDNADGDAGSGANRGAVYVMLLNADGTVGRAQKISATQGGFAVHLGRSNFFGDGVAALPDLDKNGVPDLAVGSGGYTDGPASSGAVWVVLLNFDSGTGAIGVKQALRISNNSGNLGGGLNASDAFGAAVASIGDLDGDGFPDMLAGAPGDGASGFGSSWVLNLGRSNVTLASSMNPSIFGFPVTFTSAVTPGTGNVEFLDASATIGSGLLAAGQATFTTSTLSVATHEMTAYYDGDSLNIGGPSALLEQEVENPATATLLAMFVADPLASGIQVSWQLGDPRLYASALLERAASADGPWQAIGTPAPSGAGVITVVDADVVAGQVYLYRLLVTRPDGSTQTLGQLSAQAARVITEFALGPVSPNPSTGPVRIAFALPRESAVRLSLLDVQGREVAMLADGVRPPGLYQATWSGQAAHGSDAPAGVYFVRYQTPVHTFVRRVVLTR